VVGRAFSGFLTDRPNSFPGRWFGGGSSGRKAFNRTDEAETMLAQALCRAL
jgi:hypothetical protein